MRVQPVDLLRLAGKGGEPFQAFLYDLVVAEARTHGIPPHQIAFDYRICIGDGGRDIVIRAGHSDAKPRFVPQRPSIWSAKSGANGVKASTIKAEIRKESHEVVRQHLKAGNTFVWCALQDVDQEGRDKMREAAETLADEYGFEPELIEFRWKSDLATVLNDHPGLIYQHLPGVAERLEGILTLAEWLKEDTEGFAVEWAEFASRSEVKRRLADHLLASHEPNVVHITGLSGVGKTRTVQQACRDEKLLSDVFYVRRYEDFSDKFFRYLAEDGVHAGVIIDEVQLTDLDSFIGRVGDYAERLRFVTIGPAPRGEPARQPSWPGMIWLEEPAAEAGVLTVVKNAGAAIAETVLRSIAEEAGHDLRLALLLVWATKRDPDFRDQPVVNIDGVWKRLMGLFRDEIGDTDGFRERYGVLTTCIDVGRAGHHRCEIEYLGKHFDHSTADLDRTIARAHKCGLGAVTPNFFEAGPRALAIRLFQYRAWPAMSSNVRAFLRGMPSQRLRRRFVERCQECGGSVRKEVEAYVSAFFRAELGDDPTRLADRERSRVFQAWTELAPAQGLGWLRHAMRSASHDEVLAIDGAPDGSGGWRGRRQLVWLCENLSCFAEHFHDCEEILFRLATAETEPSIGNNSTNVWRWMFWPALSCTEVPFEERLELLLGRLRDADEQTISLVLSAAVGLLEPHRSRPLPPRVVGGRIVPKEWRPKTMGELTRIEIDAGCRILAVVDALRPELRGVGATAVIQDLRNFVRLGIFEALRGLLRPETLNELNVRALRGSVDDLISTYELFAQEGEPGAEETLGELVEWKRELSPDDLASRIKDLTGRDFWAVARHVYRRGEKGDPNAAYDELAAEVLAEPEVLRALEGWLDASEARSGGPFGCSLGRLDRSAQVQGLMLGWLAGGRCGELVVGYAAAVADREKALPQVWAEAIDRAAVEHPRIAFFATLRADVSERGFERLARLVERLPPPRSSYLNELGYGRWETVLTPPRGARVLTTLNSLAEEGDTRACGVAFHLTCAWYERGKETLDHELAEPLLAIADRVLQHDDPVDPHDWGVAVGLLAPQRLQQVLENLADTLTGTQLWLIARERKSLELLIELAGRHGASVMHAIGRTMRDPERRATYGWRVYRDLFEAIGLPVVRTFVEAHGEEMAVLIARHVASPSVTEGGEPHVPELTEWLLTTFERNDEVFQAFCAGRHSMEVRWGEAADLRPEIERLVKPFRNHPVRRIREWAEYELVESDWEIEDERRRDDEDERL